MWLKNQSGKLVNLDTVAKIYIAGRKMDGYLWPTVYAQFNTNREDDAVLFTSWSDPAEQDNWSGIDPLQEGSDSRSRGRMECQLYIDTLFELIERAGVRARTVDREQIAYLMEEQIKAGKHPNLSTPEEVANVA